MPTPVSIARQCLADAAAISLDEAVKVAKKRCNTQTTPLHAITVLLYLPNFILRDACTRVMNGAYDPRRQLQALKICVLTALDRLPVSKSNSKSTGSEEPPVSNSLMAAIKRAQAHQRRQPETFNSYQQQQYLNCSNFHSSISSVKVEVKYLIMSILDDPSLGRVFCEAGFRTNEIQMEIMNPHYPMNRVVSQSSPMDILGEKVSWQIEAIQTIGRAILRCRDGFSYKGNIWFSFMGPDKVGKRKVAASIAEIIFGKQENLMYFDLSLKDSVIIDSCGSKFHSGRKMIVDCIAEELGKHPNFVMFLENIEKADLNVIKSLSHAVKTGKFQDSRGRDVTVNNIVFVLASSVQSFGKNFPFRSGVASEFPEEKILEANNFQMKILRRYVIGNYGTTKTANVSIFSSKVLSKRKVVDGECIGAETSKKRSCQSPRVCIDLNLPAEDTEEDTCKEVWLKEIIEHVDENIEFKPFDFDSLAKKFLKKIEVGLNKVVKNKMFLEIDRDVMVQMLAAAWLTNRKDAVEDWIENVLCSSLEEARRRCNVTSSDCIVQLVPCDGIFVKEQAIGVCLPAKIIGNL